VRLIASALGMSDNDVYGVATFYSQFRFQPRGKHCLKICLGTACHVRGSSLILETVGRELQVQPGETTADGKFSVDAVMCMGSCALAPVAVVDDTVYGRVTQKKVDKLLEERRQEKPDGAVATTSGTEANSAG
jgi:NADH:ubiquinone oxidoreductase subunit E